MDVHGDADVPAAAQLSQADIIERQAETIAHLQRQVKRGVEYKQMTKSKLKEAAGRLKDYRVRVETLLQEAETLKQIQKAVKPRKPSTRNAATQTAERKMVTRTSQTTLSGQMQRVNTKVDAGVLTVDALTSRKRVRTMSTQTEVDRLVPKLSREGGHQDESVSKMWTPQVLGAESFSHETSAALDAELAFSDSEDDSGHTLEMDSGHETESADLLSGVDAFDEKMLNEIDKELESSEDEVGMKAGGEIGETAQKVNAGAVSLLGSVDLSVSDAIDKELESSSDEEDEVRVTGSSGSTRRPGGADKGRVDVAHGHRKQVGRHPVTGGPPQPGGLDSEVANVIGKELESSSDEEDEGRATSSSDTRRRPGGASSAAKGRVDVVSCHREHVGSHASHAATVGPSQVGGHATTAEPSRLGKLDSEVANAIDKELESSSDEEEDTHATKADPKKAIQNAENDAKGESKRTLMSIDDELDDELAALSSSSSSSSDSASSDSSDSDTDDDDGDNPMSDNADNADKTEVVVAVEGTEADDNRSLPNATTFSTVAIATSITQTAVKVDMKKRIAGGTGQQPEDNGERGASNSSSTDTDAVVITTLVEKKPVTPVEDTYSPVVAPESQPQTPEPLQLDASTATASRADDEPPTVVVGYQEDGVQEQVPDIVQVAETVAPAGADIIAIVVAQSSLNDPSSPGMPPSTLKISASNTDQPIESRTDNTKTARKADPVSSDSAAEPSENPESGDAVLPPPNARASENVSPEKHNTIGRPRKADEAKLDDSTATARKKAKVDKIPEKIKDGPGGKAPQTSAAADRKTVTKKAAAKVETKEELRMKKPLAVFKQGIVLGKGEEADNEYARRTIAVLVNQSSKFIDTHLAHVTTLCQFLADVYRELAITPMMVVGGALGVFRTPRSRRLLGDKKLGLSWLCNQVLIRLMSSTDAGRKEDGSVSPGSLCLSLVDECLQHLRDLLVEERKNVGDFLSVRRLQVQVVAPQINVSHDKVFLAHICALHTHLCQSTGQLARSRVLLFDLLRDNPNIRGLYFAMGMLEVYPAILEREFDQHCIERQVMLKETLQQALIAIASVAAERQELLLHQSSITMLHRIADAIQMPELEGAAAGRDPYHARSYVEKLLDKLAASCQPPNSESQGNEVQSAASVDYFELAKSLEVCTAVFGLDLLTEILSIERCQELFNNANAEAKNGIIFVVGHIAMAVAPKTNDTQNPRTRSEQYVESVIDWLYHILLAETTDDGTSPDDRFKVLLGCSTVCVELILVYSAFAGLDWRRRVLCAVVRWFDATPPDRLIHVPATFLRRLRLAVVAARPQVLPASD